MVLYGKDNVHIIHGEFIAMYGKTYAIQYGNPGLVILFAQDRPGARPLPWQWSTEELSPELMRKLGGDNVYEKI
jgi:hypothetical protein